MDNPNYGNLGDHTEAVQIDFDPRRISYTALLDIFWKSHRPTQRPWSRQYMNAVFYHNAEQREQALASKKQLEKQIGRPLHTKITSVETFYRAEDYHQKYLLNRHPEIAKAFARIYPRKKDYVDSTAVARVNGYIGGNGTLEQLHRELSLLGLSKAHGRILEQKLSGKGWQWIHPN